MHAFHYNNVSLVHIKSYYYSSVGKWHKRILKTDNSRSKIFKEEKSMSKNKKKVKLEITFLDGNNGKSCYREMFSRDECTYEKIIARYLLFYREDVNSNEYVCASEKTGHSFLIMTNNRKAEAIVKYNGTIYMLGTEADLGEGMETSAEPFRGEVVLMWLEEGNGDRCHFQQINSLEGKTKSICMDSFGFDGISVLDAFCNAMNVSMQQRNRTNEEIHESVLNIPILETVNTVMRNEENTNVRA